MHTCSHKCEKLRLIFGNWVSGHLIYRRLFIQARGVVKQVLIQHLRSKRRLCRSRYSRNIGHQSDQIVDAISIPHDLSRSRELIEIIQYENNTGNLPFSNLHFQEISPESQESR